MDKHVLLALSFVCTAFGPGLQCVPVMALLQPVFLLRYCHLTASSWRLDGAAWAMQSLGSAIAYAGMFNDPAWTAAGVGVVFVLASLSTAIQLPIFYLDAKASEAFEARMAVLVFPCMWASVLFLISVASPIGSWTHPSYAFALLGSSFMQLFSLGSLPLVCFLHGWTAAVASRVLFGATNSDARDSETVNDDDDEAKDEKSKKAAKERHAGASAWALLRPCGFAWLLLLAWSGARQSVLEGGLFFQRGIDATARNHKKVHVACLLEEEQPASLLLNRTAAALEADPELKLVLWSETAALHAPGLVGAAAALAKAHGAYVGVTYLETDATRPPPNQKNMLTLIGPSGEVLFAYQKAHPVVLGVEPDVAPGPANALPVVATAELGRVGGAICFDFDFPSYVLLAAAQGADVMLQPSWTWGPIGAWHALMDSVKGAPTLPHRHVYSVL